MLEQNIEKKIDVARKLEKEICQVTSVREALQRSGQVATNVSSILDSFEHRLARLETTILPLYQQTGNLQRRQLNTEKTLQELDYVISFYNVAGQVEGVVKERPSSIGVPQYLQAMDCLAETCRYFEQNNPQSVEIENVTSLFEIGTDALSKEFRHELEKYKKPVPPMVTLELLEEEEVSEELVGGVELVPPGVREDLRAIAAWLDKHNNTDRLTVYAKLRAEALAQSLKTLREYQRSNSMERGGTPGSLNSPALPRARMPKLDPTMSRTQKFSDRATGMIKKAITGHASSSRQGSPGNASYSLHGSLTPSHGVTSGMAGEEGLDDSKVDLYLNQVTALHRLGLAEYLLAQQLVPEDRVTRTFELIIKEPMDHLTADGELLAGEARRCVGRGDHQAVLGVLAMLRHVTAMQPHYQKLLTNCQTSIRGKFASIINMLQETCVKALEGFVDSVKSEGERALPRDGTVHELTSNALIFTEQLLEFANTLSPILQRETSLTTAMATLTRGGVDNAVSARALLGAYVKRVLVNLGLALVSRSESYSDVTLRAIFRLNNYNYILKTLLSSELLNLVSMVEPQCDKMYNDQIMEQKRLYSQSWSRVLHYLVNHEDVPLSVIQAGKLRDKDRQLIKDKFAGFNKEIEEMSKVQRSYSIPDRELRESLKRDNMEYILPKYQAFYDKYVNVPFTKNTEKYIKYTPADVSSMVDKFFDVAA